MKIRFTQGTARDRPFASRGPVSRLRFLVTAGIALVLTGCAASPHAGAAGPPPGAPPPPPPPLGPRVGAPAALPRRRPGRRGPGGGSGGWACPGDFRRTLARGRGALGNRRRLADRRRGPDRGLPLRA